MLRLAAYKVMERIIWWHRRYRHQLVLKSLKSCGSRVWIDHDAIIWGASGVILGDDVTINSLTHIFGSGGVLIGSRTLISASCNIASVTHSKEVATRNKMIERPVVIEEDCWLGAGVIVLPGVRIGRGSIVGAGAVVTKDIPPLSVAVGVPARVVSQIAP
jgi:acetyltransferase-like isoleucine patch superfamily enzyme